MVVYLVKAGIDYEGEEVVHIASTEELAKEYLEKFQKARYYDTYEIEEFEIDEDYFL